MLNVYLKSIIVAKSCMSSKHSFKNINFTLWCNFDKLSFNMLFIVIALQQWNFASKIHIDTAL